MGSIDSTMKLATLLVLSLVILGAFGNPQRGGGGRRGGGGPRGGGRGKRKLLEKCGVDGDFCDDGQRPDVLPFPENARDCSSWVGQEFDKENKPDRPDREDCTVGERVTKDICVLCTERSGRGRDRTVTVISAFEYQITGNCIDDCKRDRESCLDKQEASCGPRPE